VSVALPVSAPVYRLTLRALVDGRRLVILALLALLPVIAALLYASAGEVAPEIFWARLVNRLVLPTVTAFIAVVIGASAIAEEREDGTILYLTSTPLSRLSLMVSKVLAAWTAALTLLVPSVVIAGLITLGSAMTVEQIAWPVLASVMTALCYCALSALLAMVTRRPVVIGVLYILLWEGTIATFAASADRFSIAAYGRAIASEGLVGDNGAPSFGATTGLIVLAVVSVVATWLATRRLTRTELP
jgi:ABC-2 type transport system permease protein